MSFRHTRWTNPIATNASNTQALACALLCGVMCLLVWQPLAHANGGPVAWNNHTPGGGLYFADSTLRLNKEVLRISVSKDLTSYNVHARYSLTNPSGRKQVLYGVPIFPSNEMVQAKPKKSVLQKLQASIDIRIAGKRFPCRIRKLSAAMRTEWKLTLRVPSFNTRQQKVAIQHVCVARVALPAQKRFSLDLKYKADLLYQDAMTSKSSLVIYGQRTLYYPLFPAGYWKGKVDNVDIAVDLGAYPCVKKLAPAGATRKGNLLKWSLKRVELRDQLSALKIVFDCNKQLEVYHLSRANRQKKTNDAALTGRGKAKASSVMASRKAGQYAASRAIDGDPKTAWCPATNTKKAQWLEIRVPYPTYPCHYEFTAILLGRHKRNLRHLASPKGFWLTSPTLNKQKNTMPSTRPTKARPSHKSTTKRSHPNRWWFQVKPNALRSSRFVYIRNHKAVMTVMWAGMKAAKNARKTRPKDFRLRLIWPKQVRGKQHDQCIREILVQQNCQ